MPCPKKIGTLAGMKPAKFPRASKSGRYVGFCARAQVLDAEGHVLAADHLGNCIYASLHEFASGHRDADPLNRNCSLMRQARGQNVVICHYFPDMVRIVCEAARVTLRKHGAIRLRARS